METEESKHPRFSFDNTTVAFTMKSGFELRKAEMLFKALGRDWLVKSGTFMLNAAVAVRCPYRWLVKPTVYRHFTGGGTVASCREIIKKMGKCGVKSILDYSIEAGESNEDFQAALKETLGAIEQAKDNPDVPFAVFKPTAFIRNKVLEKAGSRDLLTPEEEAEVEAFRRSVHTLCEAASNSGMRILVDAEDVAFQNLVDAVVTENMQQFNRREAVVFNTYQMYRRDRLDRLKKDFQGAVEGDYVLGAKLVRGAYLERERERARRRGECSPIHVDKSSTDLDFDRAVRFCIEHVDRISVFNGTHNEYSSRLMASLMEERGIAAGDPRCFFSQLYGMRDNISFNLAHAGYNVAKYLPYGPVEAVLPYLMRRAEENSSIAGQMGRELQLIFLEKQRRKTAR